jgi:hypothetical protein
VELYEPLPEHTMMHGTLLLDYLFDGRASLIPIMERDLKYPQRRRGRARGE